MFPFSVLTTIKNVYLLCGRLLLAIGVDYFLLMLFIGNKNYNQYCFEGQSVMSNKLQYYFDVS